VRAERAHSVALWRPGGLHTRLTCNVYVRKGGGGSGQNGRICVVNLLVYSLKDSAKYVPSHRGSLRIIKLNIPG
jgi:hypothetical protein